MVRCGLNRGLKWVKLLILNSSPVPTLPWHIPTSTYLHHLIQVRGPSALLLTPHWQDKKSATTIWGNKSPSPLSSESFCKSKRNVRVLCQSVQLLCEYNLLDWVHLLDWIWDIFSEICQEAGEIWIINYTNTIIEMFHLLCCFGSQAGYNCYGLINLGIHIPIDQGKCRYCTPTIQWHKLKKKKNLVSCLINAPTPSSGKSPENAGGRDRYGGGGGKAWCWRAVFCWACQPRDTPPSSSLPAELWHLVSLDGSTGPITAAIWLD